MLLQNRSTDKFKIKQSMFIKFKQYNMHTSTRHSIHSISISISNNRKILEEISVDNDQKKKSIKVDLLQFGISNLFCHEFIAAC